MSVQYLFSSLNFIHYLFVAIIKTFILWDFFEYRYLTPDLAVPLGTLYKLKLDFTRHIASLPLGFHSTNSTGKLRKIVDENIEYGYMFDPNDKSKWIIEPESAAVVRRIFQMTIEGMGPQEIARVLMNEKIERPSNYMNRLGITNHALTDASPYDWNDCTVKTIISKPEYCGHTVNFRTYKDSYKDRRQKLADKDDWVIFENTHPAIIETETWETAQRVRKTGKRTDSLGVANPLTGKMIWANVT